MTYSDNIIEFQGEGRVGKPDDPDVEKQAKALYLNSSTNHEHRWKLLDLFAFDGPVFLCRDCGDRRTIRD